MRSATPRRFLARLASRRFERAAAVGAGLLPALTFLAPAPNASADVTKNGTNNSLNTAASYAESVVPGTGDLILFNSTSATAPLGGSLSVLGLQVGGITSNISVGATSGATLTLGGSGINVGTSSFNFTLNNVVALGASQIWTVASGRTLTTTHRVDLGAATLSVQGAGGTNLGAGSIVTGSGAIAKSGGGTLTLSLAGSSYVASTFSGGITVGGGTLSVTGANAVGTGAITGNSGGTINIGASQLTWGGGLTLNTGSTSTLSAANGSGTGAVNLSGGTLNVTNGSALQNSTLNYTSGTFGFGTTTSSTFGGLTGSGNLALTNAAGTPAAVALTVGFSNASPAAYTGALTGLGSVVKTGSGTQILNGANTFAGTLTVNGLGGTLEIGGSSSSTANTLVQSGTLRLNFNAATAPTSNILAATSNLTLGAGTLAVVGRDNAASAQTLGTVTTTDRTSSNLSVTAGAGTGTAVLNLGGITRNVGSAVNFNLPGGAQSATNGITTTSGTADALLRTSNNNAYATVNGTDFAAKNTANTNIVPLAGTVSAGATDLGGATDNVNIDGVNGDPTIGTDTVNTVRFNDSAAARTLTINTGQLLTVASGGILVSSAVTASGTTITGGTLTSSNSTTSANNELIIHQYSAQPFTLDSAVVNFNGTTTTTQLTKTGPGTLILTEASLHSGNTNISGGVLRIGVGGNLANSTVQFGANNAGSSLDLNNQTLNTRGIAAPTTGGNAQLFFGNSGTLSLNTLTGGAAYNGSLIGGLDSVLNKVGGPQGLSGGPNLAFYGTINVNAGSINVNNQSGAFQNANFNFTATGASFNPGGFASTQNFGNINGVAGSIIEGASQNSGTPVTAFGYNGGTAAFAGIIRNGSNTTNPMAVAKFGSGAATLSGPNTYGGSTTVNSGNLILDYSTGNDVLPPAGAGNAGAVNVGNGTLTFRGGTGAALNADTTGAFALNAANPSLSTVVLDRNGGTGFQATLTTTSGGLGNTGSDAQLNHLLFDTSSSAGNRIFTSAAIATTTTGSELNTIRLFNGVLQGNGGTAGNFRAGVLFRDSTGIGFATTTGTPTATEIVRFTGAVPFLASGSAPTANYELTSGTTNADGNVQFNTLELDSSGGAVTLALDGTETFNNNSTGQGRAVLAVGSNGATITTTGTGGSGQQLLLNNYQTGTVAGQTLTLDLQAFAFLVSNGTGLTVYTRPHDSGLLVQSGTLRLTGAGSYGDVTGSSSVNLSGGVLEIGADLNGASDGDFSRAVGNQAGQVLLQGSTGFSAFGADRTVNLGGNATPTTLIWGVDRFLTSGSNVETNAVFRLSSAFADSTLVFQNPINLNASTRTVEVADGAAAVDARLSGVISNSNAVPNTLGSLTKTGAGTLELTAVNTFNGRTTVAAGTLSVFNMGGGMGRLTGTNSIVVNSGGTLLLAGASNVTDRLNDAATVRLDGGTFNTGGLSESVGALTLSASSILDLAGGASVLNFANSSAATWTGTLSIYNYSGTLFTGGGTDQVFFGNSAAGLTTAQLGQIAFFSDAGTTALGPAGILANGEVVPVPEPGTVAAGLLALGALGLGQRRRVRRWLTTARRAA